MTSLGSVCREKIAAAATELSVDSEIIKVCNLIMFHLHRFNENKSVMDIIALKQWLSPLLNQHQVGPQYNTLTDLTHARDVCDHN